MIMSPIGPIEPSEGIIDLPAACMDLGDSVWVYRTELVRKRSECSIRLGAPSHCPVDDRQAAQSVVLVGLPLHDLERCGELAEVEASKANGTIDSVELWMQLQQA